MIVIYPDDKEENTKYIDNLINRNSEICSKDKIIDIKQEKIETITKTYTGVEIMEKREAILLKDKDGTHYLPIANIASVCEEIGKYSSYYAIRTNNDKYFSITKQVYEKIIKCCYNVIIES